VGQHTNDVALLRDMQEVPDGQQKFEGSFVPEQLFRLVFPAQVPSCRATSVESCTDDLPPMAYALVFRAARKSRDAITTADFPIAGEELTEELRVHAGWPRIRSRSRWSTRGRLNPKEDRREYIKETAVNLSYSQAAIKTRDGLGKGRRRRH
jgi:hypothetical protein